MPEAPTITIRALNVVAPLAPALIPREVAHGAGEVTWYIDLNGRQFSVPATLNGRNYRRALAALDKNGGGLEVVLQGSLRSVPGTRFLELGCAGLRVGSASAEQHPAPRPTATLLGVTPASPGRGHERSDGSGAARVCFDWLAASISIDPAVVGNLGDGTGCRLKLEGWPEDIEVQFCHGECQGTAAALANARGDCRVVLAGALSAQTTGALRLAGATLSVRPKVDLSEEGISMATAPGEQPTTTKLEASPEETTVAEQLDAPETRSAATTVGWTSVVNINTASAKELATLPGLGKRTAASIIAYREESPFKAVDEIVRVNGVGKDRLARAREYLSIAGPTTLRVPRAWASSSADMPAHGEALARPEPRSTIAELAGATRETRQVQAAEGPRREPQSMRSTSKGEEPPAQGTSTLRARAMLAPSAAQLRPPAVQQAVKDEEKHMPEAEAIETIVRPLLEEFSKRIAAAVTEHLRRRVGAEVQAVVQRAFSDSTSATPALTAPVSTAGEKVSATKAVAPNECSEPGCHSAWYRPGGKVPMRCYQHFRQAGGMPPPGKKPGTGKTTPAQVQRRGATAKSTVEAARATPAPSLKPWRGTDQALTAKVVVGQSVQYRQGRGTFPARVTAVDAKTGTVLLTRLSDGKEVKRPAGKVVTTAAEPSSPPAKPEPKRSATPPKLRSARAAKDAKSDAAPASPEALTLAKPVATA